MTTLSKEDVVRWAREVGCNIITTPDDVIARYNDVRVTNMLGRFAEAARADLVAENERLKGEISGLTETKESVWKALKHTEGTLTATRTALAAAEADNERLRKALNEILTTDWVSDRVRRTAKTALAHPCDDSALRDLIAGVYEECAKECDRLDYWYSARAIRALAKEAKE